MRAGVCPSVCLYVSRASHYYYWLYAYIMRTAGNSVTQSESENVFH